SIGHDEFLRQFYLAQPKIFKGVVKRFEFGKRLIRGPCWEGMTWVLDLLPTHPQEAIDVLNAFFLAHMHFLPDGRIHGISDAQAIIRARYLHQTHPREILSGLPNRDFEFLIASVYKSLGFRVIVTAATHDGGCDVRAFREDVESNENVLIE